MGHWFFGVAATITRDIDLEKLYSQSSCKLAIHIRHCNSPVNLTTWTTIINAPHLFLWVKKDNKEIHHNSIITGLLTDYSNDSLWDNHEALYIVHSLPYL
jgi:hypothetical protein